MPAWPEKRIHIGSHAKRIDAPAKVTGSAKYSSDVQPEGCLYGMILRSKWPKAKITNISLEKAKQILASKPRCLRAKANGRCAIMERNWLPLPGRRNRL